MIFKVGIEPIRLTFVFGIEIYPEPVYSNGLEDADMNLVQNKLSKKNDYKMITRQNEYTIIKKNDNKM